MEFDFEVPGLQGQEISVWDASRLVHLKSVEFHKLRNVLEEFGQRSAVAQGLRAPITDIWRLRSSDQRLYLQTAEAAAPGSTVLVGGLKVGKKKLFIYRANGAIAEIEPLCVLDFYVHEQYQRQGIGKALFERMLAAEQLCPEQLAYDRPSPKLLLFVRKHYGLSSYVPQSNNFVVFEQHFQHSNSSSYGNMGGGRSMRSSRDSCGGSSMPQQAFNCSWGNGRQNVHVIGSAAAMEQQHGKQWLPTSKRPPTPSLQHSVQLQPADVSSSSSSGGGWAGSTCAGPAATRTLLLGGPGCMPAGMPTQRPGWQQSAATHTSYLNPCHQQQQPEVQYARGQGYKSLDRGLVAAASNSPNTFKGYEAALLGAANRPAPPLLAQQSAGGFTGTAGLRDSLDQFSSSMEFSSNSQPQQQQQQQQGSARQGGNPPPWATSDNDACAAGNGWQYRRVSDKAKPPAAVSYPSPPFGQWEPEPGSLLPAAAADTERVSLRRQEEQRVQQRAKQQVEQCKLLGAGPPGHLLAAPASSYVVPTMGMVDVISSNSHQQQQQQGSWGGSGHSQGGAAVLSLSWDGLPVAMSQQQQPGSYGRSGSRSDGGVLGARSQHPGELSNGVGSSGGYGYSSRGGSGSGMGSPSRGGLESRESAQYHMAGSGAASCLRMV